MGRQSARASDTQLQLLIDKVLAGDEAARSACSITLATGCFA